MKLKYFYLIITAIGVYLLSVGNSSGPGSVLNDGFTGAPGEKPGCFASSCHVDGNAFNNITTIEVIDKSTNLPVTTYDPGVVYEARVTIDATGAAGYGFQMVCLNSDNSDVAGFTNPGTGVKVIVAAVTSRQYAEQTATSPSNVFVVDWTAPSGATAADVTFYASGNAVNGSQSFAGDDPANATLTLTKSAANSVDDNDALRFKMALFPLPTSDQLNISVQGNFKGEFFLEVFNDIGMLMFKEKIELNRGLNDHSIDVSDFPAGSYTLRIYQNSQYKSGQFIKI